MSLERLLPAQARVSAAEADRLTVVGDDEGAKAKLAEAEKAANAPVAMTERQREITARIESIEAEKQAAARRIFESCYAEAQSVIRAAETGLFLNLLDGMAASWDEYQKRTGTTLVKNFHLTNLTAPERSAEWRSAQTWYGGSR